MLDLALQSADTAPEGSVDSLEAANEAYGFVPNLIAALANAPAAVNAYHEISKAFESSSLSRVERQVVLLTTSFENRCHYCVAAHSVVAAMAGLPPETVVALREGEFIEPPRLESLRRLTTSIVRNRGFVPEEELEAFFDVGFTQAQVLEVLTGVTQKTMSNYVNHLARTPLDEVFKRAEWVHPAERTSALV